MAVAAPGVAGNSRDDLVVIAPNGETEALSVSEAGRANVEFVESQFEETGYRLGLCGRVYDADFRLIGAHGRDSRQSFRAR